MSDAGYTKVFGSMLDSTIWTEDPATRCVWMTLMLLANRDGDVIMPLPNLARRAVVSLSQCERAINRFLSVDVHSRTKDEEGRRVVEVEGGWRLVNYHKYRELFSKKNRKEYMREYQRKRREAKAPDDSVNKKANKVLTVNNGKHPASASSTEQLPPIRSEATRAPAREPTPAALACIAMRQAGVVAVNPTHPTLTALCDAGASPEMFGDLAREATERKIGTPFPWILKTAEGRLRDAADMNQDRPTRSNPNAVDDESRVPTQRRGESLADFSHRKGEWIAARAAERRREAADAQAMDSDDRGLRAPLAQ